jgi:hypothetical protein
MAGTNSIVSWCRRIALCLCLVGQADVALAHALPGTEIVITQRGDTMTLDFAVPMPELILAMKLPKGTANMLVTQGDAIVTYFSAHLRVTDGNGRAVPVALSGWTIAPMTDEDVGTFDMLQFTASLRPVTTTGLVLHYDAVIHRVANHVASLRQARANAFRGLGVIGYDHVAKATPAFALGAALQN